MQRGQRLAQSSCKSRSRTNHRSRGARSFQQRSTIPAANTSAANFRSVAARPDHPNL